jgi:di/tricarboxylate transporter
MPNHHDLMMYEAFAVLGGAVVMFAWGRFRYDLIAVCALLVGVLIGIVPAKNAFSGFTSDVVVIIACSLVISAAVARSGLAERLLKPILPRLKTANTQVPALAGATALLSMPTKNVGALAILMPVALRVARQTGTSPSSLLMPMSFVSLLGGLVTLVGTSTNIIVSQVREQTLGKPFQMFDFAYVGLPLTLFGLAFVSVAWRLLPTGRQGQSSMGEAMNTAPFSTEALVKDGLPEGGLTISDLKLSANNVKLIALVRGEERRPTPLPDTSLQPGDAVILEGEPAALDALFAAAPLIPADQRREVAKEEASEEVRSVEAVVQPGSLLIGASAKRIHLQQQYGVNLLAVSQGGRRITERLRDVTLRAGDVLVLQAGEKTLPTALSTLGVLPLAERELLLGGVRRRWLPIIILAIAMVLVAFKVLPVAIAFFGSAVLVVATGAISMREAYGSLEGEVLILIGALTPLSDAVHATGGTDLIAHGLAHVLHGVPPLIALGILVITAMACSPFLHNAPTVLVLGPIAVVLAKGLGLHADAFLMAVATGAGCDFLTPIGHQCNTLVRGPGGYKFGDYIRLGLPLSLLVILMGTPLIAWVWHLR